MPKHPLVLALFNTPEQATSAARAIRGLGIPPERVSIVARSHDEEGVIATASGATPGSELEDSAPASRLGELSAHLLSAMALVMPGIGPIVADGPLAAGLAEAAGHVAGHVAGGFARTLEHAGLARDEAEQWEKRIAAGAVLVGAHVDRGGVPRVRQVLSEQKPLGLGEIEWSE
jgi:hypothetical protein